MFQKQLKSPVVLLPLIFFVASLSLLSFWQKQNLHHITGDEPHYLIMADGLLPTFELEQTGPYAREFRNYTINPFGLAPRGAVPTIDNTDAIQGPHGLFNIHNLGLPIILAVPYLFAGVLGARLTVIAIGALVIALLALLARACGATDKQTFAIVGPMAFCMPFMPASTQIYPDLPAGFLLLVGLMLLAYPHVARKNSVLLISSCGLALLPWFHLKFGAPLAILLVAVFYELRKFTHTKRTALLLVVPTVVSVCLLMYYNKYAFNNILGPYETKDVQATSFTVLQFFGLLTDQNQGILIQQPLHLVGIFMFGRLVREKTNLIITASLLAVSTLGINSTHWAIYGGWSFSGRFAWTSVVCFSVVTVVALVSVSKRYPKVFQALIIIGIAVQLRYIFGLVVQKKELLPHFFDSWVGTYSIFWRPIENALPRWTSESEAFQYFPNLIAASLVILLLVIGLRTSITLKFAGRFLTGLSLTSVFAVILFSIMWNPTLMSRYWNGDQFPGQVGIAQSPSRTVSEPSPAGFLTFGPRWRTPVGQFQLTMQYQGTSDSNQPIGQLDVFSPVTGRVLKAVKLLKTESAGQEITVKFEVTKRDEGPLEFRTYYYGSGTMTTFWVRITPL